MTPNKATMGAAAPAIVVVGSNFVARSVIQVDGAPLATTFVSASELRASLPSSKLAAVGKLRISVGTAPPGGGASKDLEFAVENPVPSLTSLTPLSLVAGSAASELSVAGDGFVAGAKVVFGTTDLATTVTGSTLAKATVPASLLATSGSFPVKVVNPVPGGGASTTLSFTVSNPNVAITGISPMTAFINAASFTLTVNGSGFVGASGVLFNGAPMTTTFQSSTRLTAQIPASSLAATGDIPVAVQSPPPGGGVSAPAVFKVLYPVPTAASVAPSSVNVGAGPTEITLTGTGFSQATQITVDDAPSATVLVDATRVKTTLSAIMLATAGARSIRAVNPAPGGGSSLAIAFTVTNAGAVITSLTPATLTAGGPDANVTIAGSGFVSGSVVKANNVAIVTTFVSATQLTAVVPSTLLSTPRQLAITVTNPPPGGGTSAARNLAVACDSTGVAYPLSALATTTIVTPTWSATGLLNRFSGTFNCGPGVALTTAQQPGRYYLVQNVTSAPAVLSTWADCSDITNGDAFMAVYRRSTAPATDAERRTCASVVTEGGAYASPEANASTYCPGLTKTNGGGITLAVCERAVVHIQPYDSASTTFPPPKRVKFRLEAP